MNQVMTSDQLKWMPFGVLTLCVIITTGFWKIEKSREEPLKPISQTAASPSGQPQPVMEGKVAPLFTLPALRGGEISLADYKGKFVFLNIWASWCAPCREEMPSMQRLSEKMKGLDFAMLSLSIDEKREDVVKFVEELGLTFAVALDPEQKVAAQYKITGVPETYLIGKNGIVLHHIIGPGEWDKPSIVAALTRAAGGAVETAPQAGAGAASGT